MTDGDYYGGSDWSYRRGTVGGMTSRGYGRYGGYGGYDDYCASPPVHKRAKRPFSHALCVSCACADGGGGYGPYRSGYGRGYGGRYGGYDDYCEY